MDILVWWSEEYKMDCPKSYDAQAVSEKHLSRHRIYLGFYQITRDLMLAGF